MTLVMYSKDQESSRLEETCCGRYLGATNSGQDLCQNGAVDISFTNFSWPVGVKRDRGLNITFVKDVILPAGGVVLGSNPGAADASTSVAISFKDDTNHFRCAPGTQFQSTTDARSG